MSSVIMFRLSSKSVLPFEKERKTHWLTISQTAVRPLLTLIVAILCAAHLDTRRHPFLGPSGGEIYVLWQRSRDVLLGTLYTENTQESTIHDLLNF